MSLLVVPLTLDWANELIRKLHRHHKPVQGHRFSFGVISEGELVGACCVGRPVCREVDQYLTVEVTRLVTDGTKNACSFMYARAARIAREMGFHSIQTYILENEPGTSLEAAGWKFDGMTEGGNWNHSKQYAGKRRTDQPMGRKKRYVRELC
jgi:hypothetical protein